jgi:hypothetical protein
LNQDIFSPIKESTLNNEFVDSNYPLTGRNTEPAGFKKETGVGDLQPTGQKVVRGRRNRKHKSQNDDGDNLRALLG